MENAINWFEIPVDDLDRAKRFYETIFDIEMMGFDPAENVRMALFPMDESSVGGALVQNKEFYHTGTSGPVIYLNANPDLTEVEGRVEKAGGSVVISKRIISPEHGYMAIIKDTEGNRIALHSDR